MSKILSKVIEGWKLLPGMHVALIINALLFIGWIIYMRNCADIAGAIITTLLLPALFLFALNLGWMYDKDRS